MSKGAPPGRSCWARSDTPLKMNSSFAVPFIGETAETGAAEATEELEAQRDRGEAEDASGAYWQ